MNVEDVSAPNGYAYGLQKAQADEPDGPQAAGVEVVNSEPPESDDEGTQGVIRLLQEGHFKGVADVRLRINFFGELAAIGAGELKAAAEDQIGGVLGVVDAACELVPVLGEPPGDEEEALLGLQGAFEEAANNAKEEFMGAETPSKEGLIEALNAAFGAFVEGLWEIYGPGPEVMEEEAPAGEGESTEETVEGYIAELEAAFEAAMGDLLGALDGVAVLPELSEASGSGVAYDKFLAIYNEMRGFGVGSQDSDGTGAVETTV